MSLSPRRAGAVLAFALALVCLLAIPGRRERASANSQELRGIERVAALAAGKRPSEYRITTFADCLLYPVGGAGARDPYALELCFDAHGRVVTGIDRHPRSRTRIWSIRYNPSLATVRFSTRSLFRTFTAIDAFPKGQPFDGTLPLFSSLIVVPGSQGDSGPIPVGVPTK